jgi:hypothetical protein
MSDAPLAGAALGGRQVEQPPLLLRLLPLPVLPGPGERRVHRVWRCRRRRGLGGTSRSPRGPPHPRPARPRGGEVRRSCGRCVLLLWLPLAATRRWRRGARPLADDEGAAAAPSAPSSPSSSASMPTWTSGMPSAVASMSPCVGATRKAPPAEASPGQGSCHPRCARACFRGCGPARSTSGGGRRRCCTREEGEI